MALRQRAKNAGMMMIKHGCKTLEKDLAKNLLIIPDVISEGAHDRFVKELRASSRLRRKKYEFDHWDNVIVGYRELGIELNEWSQESQLEITAIQHQLEEFLETEKGKLQTDIQFLAPHVIDLKRGGYILPHVDSKFSGEIVAGLSLMSTRRMVLTQPQGDYEELKSDLVQQPAGAPIVELYLPPRSMYILSGFTRHNLSHAIPTDESISWDNMPTVKGDRRRLSIIFRDSVQESGR